VLPSSILRAPDDDAREGETSGALLLISEDEHRLQLAPWCGIPVMRRATFVGRVDAMRRKRGRAHRAQST
jgi:hypothetical protein